MSSIKTAVPPPKLTLIDTNISSGLPTEIVFQYAPNTMTENRGAAWAESTGHNRAHPILQYSNGELASYAFEARLFAHNNALNVDDLLNALKLSVERDEELRRPPRWHFTWGTFIDETVVVQSIGGIRYDQVRPDGSIRGCTFSINLLVYRSIDVELVAEDRPSDTFFAATKSGDQWEDIALREYNDPMLGELLRRRNPGLMFPGAEPGTIVKLPKIETLRNEVIEPDSPPLRRTKEGLALRNKMFAARNKPRSSSIILKE